MVTMFEAWEVSILNVAAVAASVAFGYYVLSNAAEAFHPQQ